MERSSRRTYTPRRSKSATRRRPPQSARSHGMGPQQQRVLLRKYAETRCGAKSWKRQRRVVTRRARHGTATRARVAFASACADQAMFRTTTTNLRHDPIYFTRQCHRTPEPRPSSRQALTTRDEKGRNRSACPTHDKFICRCTKQEKIKTSREARARQVLQGR